MPLLGQVDAGIYRDVQPVPWPGVGGGGVPANQAGPNAAMMRLGLEEQENQQIRQLAQQYGSDYDGLVEAVSQINPKRGFELKSALEASRKEAAAKSIEETKGSIQKLDMGARWLQTAAEQPDLYPVIRNEILKQAGPAAGMYNSILPQPGDPDLSDKLTKIVTGIALPTKDYLETKNKAAQLYFDGKKVEGALTLMAGSKTPEQWSHTADIVKGGGLGKLLDTVTTPEQAQQMLTDQQALQPPSDKEQSPEVEAIKAKEQELGRKLTSTEREQMHHKWAQEGHITVVAGSLTPSVELKPGTRDYRLAQDIAAGKLGMTDFNRMFGRGAQFAERKAAIYDTARQINPDFSPTEFEAGLKVASNPKIRMQVGSLNNVMSGVPDLIKASDAASSSGIRLLNSYIKKGGLTVGGQNYTDFNTAVTAFADELSGALGYGSATDMSREMGFSMTDRSMSPEKFKHAMQTIVVPFVERKKASITGQMGPYRGLFEPKAGPNDVVAPNGKTYHFATKAAADAFKKSAGIP